MTDVILRSLSFYLHQHRWGTRNAPNANKRSRNSLCLGRKINNPQISPNKYQLDSRSYSILGRFNFFFKCFRVVTTGADKIFILPKVRNSCARGNFQGPFVRGVNTDFVPEVALRII